MQGRGKVNRWMGGRRKGEGRCCWRREEKDPCALSICEIRATKQPRGIFDPDSADIPRGSKIGYIYIYTGFREELLRQRLWVAINLLYFQRPILSDIFLSLFRRRNGEINFRVELVI